MAIVVGKEQLERFLEGIRLGMKIKHACAYGDFNPKTYYDWKKRALGDTPEAYPEECALYGRYLATKAKKTAGLLASVHKGALTDWRAAMRLLELDGYTVKQEVDATISAKPATIDMSKCSREQLRAFRKGRDIETADSSDAPARSPSKLVAADVLAFREEFAGDGVTMEQLAARHGVGRATISRALRGLSWKHAGGPIYSAAG